MELLTAFIIGLAGSFHCIGMCGPIAMSLPAGNPKKWSFISGRLLYNGGRIITYGFLGAVFGLLGNRISIFGYQRSLSVAVGMLIIISVIFTFKYSSMFSGNSLFNKLMIKFKILFSKVYKRKSKTTMLLTGILNGFLPCGFVYIGLSGAMLSGEVLNGTFYMILFGLGTVPLMLGVSVFGNFLSFGFKKNVQKLIPVFAVILAVLFILRGLNLGIPFISPQSNISPQTEDVICN
ncbi:MAG: sulfite exporter TauE/SafE family protein [Ignavibacteria bacterium]|nr:sulfite exporter TauE/SafE family protein [Ignavibacteria bacterium]